MANAKIANASYAAVMHNGEWIKIYDNSKNLFTCYSTNIVDIGRSNLTYTWIDETHIKINGNYFLPTYQIYIMCGDDFRFKYQPYLQTIDNTGLQYSFTNTYLVCYGYPSSYPNSYVNINDAVVEVNKINN